MRFFLLVLFLLNFSFAQVATNETEDNSGVNKNTSKLEVGVDFDQQDSFVDDNYQKGNYLVYDCTGEFWVCTGKTEHRRCKENRKNALKNYKKNIRCAHFAEFDSREECYKEQQRVTHLGPIDRFCLHPIERDRTKDF